MIKDEDRKVVMVLGAYGGTGSGVCRYNYVRGARVVMVGRDETKLLELKNDYDNSSTLAIVGDANNEDDVRKTFDKAVNHFSKVDEVWITVGKDGGWEMDYPEDPEEVKSALWNKLYPSLLKPVEVVCPIATEFFKKQGYGILVHLSSHVAFKGEDELKGNYTYRRLKLAAEEVVLNMRKALKGTEATAINLRPAIVRTPGNTSLLKTEKQRTEAVQPETLAEWVDMHAHDPDLPENKYFHSDVVI